MTSDGVPETQTKIVDANSADHRDPVVSLPAATFSLLAQKTPAGKVAQPSKNHEKRAPGALSYISAR
jgi:hypothetical protein